MNKLLTITIILILLFALKNNIVAQNIGKIQGNVKDSKTLQNVPSAIASLVDLNTNKTIKKAQTDSLGTFTFTEVPYGIFIINISLQGYQAIHSDSVILTRENNDKKIGDVKINTIENTLLKEVIVTSSSTKDKINISTKKFSVEHNLVSNGGNTTDLLQSIPTVTIDTGGNINLRGSSKVNILIDGKPSLIGGSDIMQVLQSLPASSVESIELITNPSSKYESSGDVGIINIVLKKNKKLGFNGSVHAFAGTRNNYNGSVGLSFENSKLNIYANYDYQHSNIRSNGHQNIQYLNSADPVVYSNEDFPSTTINKVHNIKAGLDYYFSPKDLLSFTGGFNTNTLPKNESLSIQQYNSEKFLLQNVSSLNLTNTNGTTYNANIDFIKTFNKPKEELVFSIGYAHGDGNSKQNFSSDFENNIFLIKNLARYDTTIIRPISDNNNQYFNAQIDYTLPIGTGSFNAGYRSQVRLDNRNQTVYSFNTITRKFDEYYPYSAYFHGNNQIHAAYISYQNQIKDFGYQVGLRFEAANLKGNVGGFNLDNYPLNTPVKVVNNRLYPSITLTQKLEDNQLLQLSYSRRVTRPTPRNYNPMPDISDPVNYDVGNPNIKPEDIHSFELGYQKKWEKISFISSLYYRITNDYITHVELPPTNGIITTTAENIPHAYTGGLEIVSIFNLMKAWSFTANTNLYENNTNALPAYGIAKSNGLSWNTNITNNITITKNISLQIRSDYQAPNVIAQDRNYYNFGVDAGAKINLFNNKASLTINGKDILVTKKWSFLRNGNNVILDFERRTIGARAGVNFTYNFGGNIFKKKSIEHSSEKQDN